MTNDSISFLVDLFVVAVVVLLLLLLFAAVVAVNELHFLWIQCVEAWFARVRNLEWMQFGTILWLQLNRQAHLRHSGTFEFVNVLA